MCPAAKAAYWQRSFNGAMPFQAWIYLDSVHTNRPCRRFNGAMPFQAWISAGCGRDADILVRCFNGAMPFQAWIFSSFSSFFAWVGCFNGAMPFQAWISAALGKLERLRTLLQWGHAFSGMDMPSLNSRPSSAKRASMGPCLFRHGYAVASIQYHAIMCELQWGHAFSGMDITRPKSKRGRVPLLQWGHAFSGMDMSHILTRCAHFYWLQWGHAFSGMDMRCPSRRTDPHYGRFNGAMPFQAWISGFVVLCEWEVACFNGAMPFQAWI